MVTCISWLSFSKFLAQKYAPNIETYAFKIKLCFLDTKYVQMVHHGRIPSMIVLRIFMVFAQQQHWFGIDAIRDVKRLKLSLKKYIFEHIWVVMKKLLKAF